MCVCLCMSPSLWSIGANTYLVCLIVTLYVMPQSFLQNGRALYCMFPNFGKLVLLSVHCRLTYSKFWTVLRVVLVLESKGEIIHYCFGNIGNEKMPP